MIEVTPGGAAEKAGVRRGDVVWEVDGAKLAGRRLAQVLQSERTSHSLKLAYMRGEEGQAIEVRPLSNPLSPPPLPSSPLKAHLFSTPHKSHFPCKLISSPLLTRLAFPLHLSSCHTAPVTSPFPRPSVPCMVVPCRALATHPRHPIPGQLSIRLLALPSPLPSPSCLAWSCGLVLSKWRAAQVRMPRPDGGLGLRVDGENVISKILPGGAANEDGRWPPSASPSHPHSINSHHLPDAPSSCHP